MLNESQDRILEAFDRCLIVDAKANANRWALHDVQSIVKMIPDKSDSVDYGGSTHRLVAAGVNYQERKAQCKLGITLNTGFYSVQARADLKYFYFSEC